METRCLAILRLTSRHRCCSSICGGTSARDETQDSRTSLAGSRRNVLARSPGWSFSICGTARGGSVHAVHVVQPPSIRWTHAISFNGVRPLGARLYSPSAPRSSAIRQHRGWRRISRINRLRRWNLYDHIHVFLSGMLALCWSIQERSWVPVAILVLSMSSGAGTGGREITTCGTTHAGEPTRNCTWRRCMEPSSHRA